MKAGISIVMDGQRYQAETFV